MCARLDLSGLSMRSTELHEPAVAADSVKRRRGERRGEERRIGGKKRREEESRGKEKEGSRRRGEGRKAGERRLGWSGEWRAEVRRRRGRRRGERRVGLNMGPSAGTGFQVSLSPREASLLAELVQPLLRSGALEQDRRLVPMLSLPAVK